MRYILLRKGDKIRVEITQNGKTSSAEAHGEQILDVFQLLSPILGEPIHG